MFEWLQYDFMIRALAATTVLSFSVAPVGAFLVLRRLSLAGEAMAHAIVPGIVIAFVVAGLSVTSMIIGGLTATLCLTLFVIPVFYEMFSAREKAQAETPAPTVLDSLTVNQSVQSSAQRGS